MKQLWYRIKRVILRALGRELENKAEQEVHKAFNKQASSSASKECEYKDESNVQAKVEVATATEPANDAAAQAELLKQQNEMMRNAMAMQAMSGAQSKASLKDVNEMMSYFEFDKEMNIVGVKQDAPDWIKQAYASGQFNTKD